MSEQEKMQDAAPEAQTGKKKKEKVKKSLGQEILEWVLTLAVAVVAALVIRAFVFEPVRVDGESMDDTLANGEIMFVSKFDYSSIWLNMPFTSDNAAQRAARLSYGTPNRLDVVICRYPARGAMNFVKRVVGLPGETIELRDGYLYVNGEQVEAEKNIDTIASAYRKGASSFGPYVIPKKGDSLKILDGQMFLLNGEYWQRANTPVKALDGDGKELKVLTEKADESSADGMRAQNIQVISYDGKEYRGESAIAEILPTLTEKEFKVNEDYFFVMGDHRNNSNDCRQNGALERSMIVGHVRQVVFPFGQWRGVK